MTARLVCVSAKAPDGISARQL